MFSSTCFQLPVLFSKNTWQILFLPGGVEESGKIFGRAYIPETPGVNPNEEKEVEFCSEVLILASTFQAAVGKEKKKKKKKKFTLLAMLRKLAI